MAPMVPPEHYAFAELAEAIAAIRNRMPHKTFVAVEMFVDGTGLVRAIAGAPEWKLHVRALPKAVK